MTSYGVRGPLKVRCARGFGGAPMQRCKGASSESYAHETHTHIVCVLVLKGPGKSATLVVHCALATLATQVGSRSNQYRVATFLEIREKSGKSKVVREVREKRTLLTKVREKQELGDIF